MENKGSKFCRTLEELVKCPICSRRLGGDIVLCETGHSVCRGCTYNGLHRCIVSTCRKPYTQTRNVLAQEFLTHLDDIKACLMEMDTFGLKSKLGKNVDQSPKDELLPGQFRCWLTNDCKFVGYSTMMYNHCKNSHPLEFDENPNTTLPYTHNWQMNYYSGSNLNRAVNIPNVGLFILFVFKTEHDEMRACVFMCAPGGIAFQYSYKIEIECDEKKLSYNGQVDSARIPENIVIRSGRKGLFINRNEPLYHALRDKLRFKCSISIEKTSRDKTDEITPLSSGNQVLTQGKKNTHRRGNVNRDRGTDNQPLNIGQRIKKGHQNQSKSHNIDHNKHRADFTNLTREPQNIPTNSIPIPTANTYQSHENSQLLPPKTLYPNLIGSGVAQGPPINLVPMPTKHGVAYQRNANVCEVSPVIVNHFEGTNIPSAPYERPPPMNPHFKHEEEQTKKKTIREMESARKKKQDDACTVS